MAGRVSPNSPIAGAPADPAAHRAGLEGVGYVAISANDSSCYLVRSDGAVDRTKSKGKVTQQFVPAAGANGATYIGVSAGMTVSYLVRSDGVVVRTRGNPNKGDEMAPPAGAKYLAVSASNEVTYLVRSDGVLDRTRGGAKVGSEHSAEAPIYDDAIKYIGASAGMSASYFVRDDGLIDRATGGGKIQKQLRPADGATYVAVSDQLQRPTGNSVEQNHANYLIQSDGTAHRTVSNGKVCGFAPTDDSVPAFCSIAAFKFWSPCGWTLL